ncbi:hypothetical protein [Larkinella arboricola]|uniref:Uncharacterized protein n=1 Tax=Larkinella arboricola TaxID=643671 RepID=A0A327WL70_LARAB|nr:hypothetical protein [Larkinella arboricola]RAJ92505.1 hypothetical protein LX87_04835 [Larkinella arboricola]
MDLKPETSAAHFVAALEGVELSREQHERIASGIQEVVMKELASIDLNGDLAFAKRFKIDRLKIRPGDLINGIRLKLVREGLFQQ